MLTDRAFLDAALAASGVKLSLDLPQGVDPDAPEVETVLTGVREIYGEAADSDYFRCSLSRYRLYFAVARTLPPGAAVLDVGAAPGHVSAGLHLMGLRVEGVNLNEHWNHFYPSPEWMEKTGARVHDFERGPLPWEDARFDAVFFCEVLEHVAVREPAQVLADLRRVLKPGGLLLLSTPNVCNLSNLYALLKGRNVMWDRNLFYGGLDRHNREFTPVEVEEVLRDAGFPDARLFGWNCDSNWRCGAGEWPYHALAAVGDRHPLLRNTVVAMARNPDGAP